MRSEELNTQLYNKMAAEQAKYRDWLLTLPAAGVLGYASEYSFREDILMSLDGQDLTEAQAKALLRSPTPLADVYREWEKRDPSYMGDIWDTLASRADEMIRREREKNRSEGAR